MAKQRGRPKEFNERKVIKAISLTPTAIAFLSRNNDSASREIELAIRNTMAFIEWERKLANDKKPPIV